MAKVNSTGAHANPEIALCNAPASAALCTFARRAWAVHNILTFMVEVIEDDTENGLPVRCTLTDMLGMISALANDLSDASDEFHANSIQMPAARNLPTAEDAIQAA